MAERKRREQDRGPRGRDLAARCRSSRQARSASRVFDLIATDEQTDGPVTAYVALNNRSEWPVGDWSLELDPVERDVLVAQVLNGSGVRQRGDGATRKDIGGTVRRVTPLPAPPPAVGAQPENQRPLCRYTLRYADAQSLVTWVERGEVRERLMTADPNNPAAPSDEVTVPHYDYFTYVIQDPVPSRTEAPERGWRFRRSN